MAIRKYFRVEKTVEDAGLEITVIESIPVHEDIKQGKPNRDKLIENYKTSIENVGKAGIPVVCYNFMPVFDWTRSDLNHPLPDGSTSLAFLKSDLEGVDPIADDLNLPGWDSSYSKEEMKAIIENYRHNISEEDLWMNLEYFIKAIMPTAEAAGVKWQFTLMILRIGFWSPSNYHWTRCC